MEHAIHFVDIALFIGLFLISTAILQIFSNKTSFPYTVLLLVVGFFAQFINSFFHLNIHFSIDPQFIFFFLLPILLFEAAMHINLHQFRLQFKTISFLATFGLLVSVFIVAAVLALVLDLPFGIALLFGALISATDPIAVLALFKTLGAPKRLALVADGESMFNDATGVIAFRVVSTFVVGNELFGPTKLIPSFGDLLYIFFGSIVLGSIIGYVAARVIEKVKNERVIITALTMAVGLGSFAGAEHFFHMSGVITCVMAGIVLGNLARAKMTGKVAHFLEEFWEYLGFLSLSLVFFFATFSMDVRLFSENIWAILVAIFSVLLARAVSVYVSSFFSNRLSFFNDEPNIPMNWQHILSWGGLRGVIPLVLVYSLPDTFVYKELMLQFTLGTLLSTLFINGLTIKWFLLRLKLHLPQKEEVIINEEIKLFELDDIRQRLKKLDKREFDASVLTAIDKNLLKKEKDVKDNLLALSSAEEFSKSLTLESLNIERRKLQEFFQAGKINENVFYEFDSELDLQQDALEYPEVFQGRAIKRGGFISSKRKTARKRLLDFRKKLGDYPGINILFPYDKNELEMEHYVLHRIRIITSYAVLDYLERVEKLFNSRVHKEAIESVRKTHKEYIKQNDESINKIEKNKPVLVMEYQKTLIKSIISESNPVYAPDLL